MLQIQMKGYATIENAMKAANKFWDKHGGSEIACKLLKVRWWTVVPTGTGRFVPMLHCGDCPGGPGWFLGSPFYIIN